MLKGVEVIEINPPYTSVIGMLKYAPQLSIDKHIAGAYVIGRRALGFKEDMPENYEKLLKDRTYLEFALKRYEEREKELTELVEKETNEYKRNALESELRSVENARKLLTNFIQSLQSEPSGCEGANGRNPAWQVLKVALLFPILGKVLPRDLSPLKPVLVEGVWDRMRDFLEQPQSPFDAEDEQEKLRRNKLVIYNMPEGIFPKVQTLLGLMLEKDHEKRFKTAKELINYMPAQRLL